MNFIFGGTSNGYDMIDSPYKDVSQWNTPVYKFASIEDLIGSGFSSDGIYQTSVGSNTELDMLLQNANLSKSDGYALVGFNGAITKREEKKSPFFSGVSVTSGFDVPYLSFSDPTLDIDGKLSLAWYAGNEDVPDLPQKVAQILNAFARERNLKLVLFGGSGAGFAILNMLAYLRADYVALVWNPQTNIVNYFTRFVERYARTGFPALWKKMRPAKDTKGVSKVFLDDFFSQLGISYKLNKINIDGNGQVIFLQNREDWHVETHAEPFLAKFGPWLRVGPATFRMDSLNFGVVFGEWGEGHAAPPRATIRALLEYCLNNKSPLSAEDNILHIFEQEQRYEWSLAVEKELLFDLSVQYFAEDRMISASIQLVNAKPQAKYTYAFYLLVNGIRQQFKWYGSGSVTEFCFEMHRGKPVKVEIVGFVKDEAGKICRKGKRVVV